MMAYEIPKRLTGRAAGAKSRYHLTVQLPPEIRKQMAAHDWVSWGKVCRDAIEQVIARLEKKKAR